MSGLDPTTHGVSPDRFLEALVGGGVALIVAQPFRVIRAYVPGRRPGPSWKTLPLSSGMWLPP